VDSGESRGPTPSGVNFAPPMGVFGPTAPEQRLHSLDTLRGFALFGILWINLPGPSWGLLADRIVAELCTWLVQGKFLTIFGFVFGVGFWLQFSRAAREGRRPVSCYLRRLFFLFLIGVCHYLFIWDGDVLTVYALFGVYLLAVYGLPQKAILALALVVFCATIVRTQITLTHGLAQQTGAAQASQTYPARLRERREQLRREQAQFFATSSYAQLASERWAELKEYYGSGWSYCPNSWFVYFLLGLWAGRRGILQDPHAHTSFLRRFVWWGLPAGLITNLAYTICYNLFYAGRITWLALSAVRVLGLIGRPILGLSYAAGLLLLLQSERWRSRLAPLRFVGRMALTSYLMQSLVFTAVAYGWGLGWYSKLTGSIRFLYAVVFFTAQACLSRWWLARFRFGPAEWLWRSLTYGNLQPWRAYLMSHL
jgi:uncharacterized protein